MISTLIVERHKKDFDKLKRLTLCSNQISNFDINGNFRPLSALGTFKRIIKQLKNNDCKDKVSTDLEEFKKTINYIVTNISVLCRKAHQVQQQQQQGGKRKNNSKNNTKKRKSSRKNNRKRRASKNKRN